MLHQKKIAVLAVSYRGERVVACVERKVLAELGIKECFPNTPRMGIVHLIILQLFLTSIRQSLITALFFVEIRCVPL